jgi:hypothetical protein
MSPSSWLDDVEYGGVGFGFGDSLDNLIYLWW